MNDRERTNITLNVEIKKKARRKVGNRGLSDYINDLLREDLDEEIEEESLLSKTELTDKQKKVVNLLFQEKVTGKLSEAVKEIRGSGLYQRPDHIQEALKRISRNDFAPFVINKGKLEEAQIQCECGSQYFPEAIRSNTDGKCINCEKLLIDLNAHIS